MASLLSTTPFKFVSAAAKLFPVNFAVPATCLWIVLTSFILTLPYDEKTKSLIKELPDYATRIYWQGFIRFKIDSKALLIEVIENLLKYKNWHELYRITHSQKDMLNTEEIISIISKSTQKMIEEKVEIGNNMSYLIKQLLSTVYQRIGSDYENHPELLELELRLYSIIGWDNMKCCHYLFKRNANLLADIISLIYKKDDGNSDDEIETDRFRFFFRLERAIKFCPGEENGSVDIDVLNEWIRVFRNRLENQGQSFLLYKQLGKLFACSPSDTDDTDEPQDEPEEEEVVEGEEELTEEELLEGEIVEILEEKIKISFEASEGGSVSMSEQELGEEDEVEAVTATADEGYEFVNWTKDGEEVSTSEEFTPAKEEATYVANFEEVEEECPAQSFEDSASNGITVKAYVPLSEMFGYATDLRSFTQGRGNYMMQMDHYSEVPKSIAEKVAKKNASGE